MENKNYNNQNKEKLSKLWGKVGFVVNLSQMIEYNLANILAADEVLRNFENSESVAAFEYNEFVEKSNKWDEKLLNKPMGVIINRAKQVNFSQKILLKS